MLQECLHECPMNTPQNPHTIRRVSRREELALKKAGLMLVCDHEGFSCYGDNRKSTFYCCAQCGHGTHAICEQCLIIENYPVDIVRCVRNGMTNFTNVPKGVVDRIVCTLIREEGAVRPRHLNCKMPVIYIDNAPEDEVLSVNVRLAKEQKFTVVAPPFSSMNSWEVIAGTLNGQPTLYCENGERSIPTDSLFYETSHCDLRPRVSQPLQAVRNEHIYETLITAALSFGLNIQRASMFAQFWTMECGNNNVRLAFITDETHLEEQVSSITICSTATGVERSSAGVPTKKDIVLNRLFVYIQVDNGVLGAMIEDLKPNRKDYVKRPNLSAQAKPVLMTLTEWGGVYVD